MKKILGLVFVSILGGIIALGSYKLFFEPPETTSEISTTTPNNNSTSPFSHTTFVSHHSGITTSALPGFTKAARKTVKAVVHVKNVKVTRSPRNLTEYLRGMRARKYVRGTGSGVIITPDGYIVTNYHVIKGASELEVTLHNNLTYTAKVVGTAPRHDIALLKIDAEDLHYLPFGNSNNVKVGQWVLAVGNPFNLTSTVTAGIVSAKGRNLNEGGTKMLSFIQTDAAINPGNSGGALVNTHGELIGINTAITSRTGSYIGYSFAIPSNNARKIVEDLMQYGDVKRAILGITGYTIKPERAKKFHFNTSQGVHVVSSTYGAEKAGLQKGDLITEIDGVKVREMPDLAAYLASKRPGDQVQVNYFRDGHEKITKITLTEYITYALKVAGLEITNASDDYLRKFQANHGVRITQTLSRQLSIPKNKYIIVAIDGQAVSSVEKVKAIMQQKSPYEKTYITFQRRDGQRERYPF